MTFAGTLTNAKYVFIAVRTPALPLTPLNHDVFADSISLLEFDDDTPDNDLDITLGATTDYSFNCGSSSGNVSGVIDETLSASTMYIARLDFQVARTMVGGSIGSTSFTGRIGEIMVFNNSPSAGDLTNVCSYLNAKH